MNKLDISPKIEPYLEHPLVQKISSDVLADLDTPDLNNAIRAESQIIQGLRELAEKRNNLGVTRLHPGNFGSSINIGRALTFTDVATYRHNVKEICDEVYNFVPAKRSQFIQNLNNKIIPALVQDGIIKLSPSGNNVVETMPYPVASKYYTYIHLLKKPKLYTQQINHFEIIHNVQDFPQLKSQLEADSSVHTYFNRDYSALEEIDVIRSHNVGGREYSFAKTYITGEKSFDTWLSVLETSDPIRMGFRELLVLTGELGGFVTLSEIAEATGKDIRIANRLIRHVDNLGLAQRTHNLQLETALCRPTSGTLLNMNYTELSNAPAILSLIRSEPCAVKVLQDLHDNRILDEDELISKYGMDSVQKIVNTLEPIGIVSSDALREAKLEVVRNRGIRCYLSDVLAIAANTRKIIDPEYDLSGRLKGMIEDMNEDTVHKTVIQAKLDYYHEKINEIKH